MSAGTDDDLRRAMINCSKGDAKRMTVPGHVDPATLDPSHPDPPEFLGWHDPRLPGRAYLLARYRDAVVGVLVRPAAAGARRTAMCALCRTTRTDGQVSLHTAPRAGAAGRAGNSVGTYICDDLACSAMVRTDRSPAPGVHPDLSGTIEERAEGLRDRLDAFLDSIVA